jgi:SAM-dependent methyltransferase
MAGDEAATLVVHSSLGESDDLPVRVFFRNEVDFFSFEQAALELCRGRVLDAGAGTGVHALELQRRGFEVRAIDVLPEAVAIMRGRGVLDAVRADLFELEDERFDTLLMLMNGIGPVGTIGELRSFFETARRLLAPSGQVLVDSGEAMICEPRAGAPNIVWPPPTSEGYRGEAWIRLEYAGEIGPPFRELYLGAEEMMAHAALCGWRCDIAHTDDSGAFLACLRPGRAIARRT